MATGLSIENVEQQEAERVFKTFDEDTAIMIGKALVEAGMAAPGS